MDNRHSIGSKIQKYRKLKDMTQDELSKQSGIYLSTIKKYESGERNPKPDQLQKIAEALGISVTVFLDYDINTISDVLSLVMKLNEQSPLKISADKDKDGNWIGFDADMAKLVGEKLGVEVDFVEIDWDNKVMELNSKNIDVVWNGMTLTSEVTSAMECTNAYCNNAQVVVVPEGK